MMRCGTSHDVSLGDGSTRQAGLCRVLARHPCVRSGRRAYSEVRRTAERLWPLWTRARKTVSRVDNRNTFFISASDDEDLRDRRSCRK
jgi:hypothetical protein